MKKLLLMAIGITSCLFCACVSQTVIDGISVKAEPVEWKYDSKEVMKTVTEEIGDESDAWNELYYPGATVRQTDESNILLFDNSRIAVLKSDKESAPKIIDTKAYYPDQFGSLEDQIMLSKTAYFDISQNGRFTLLCCGIDGQPLYLFDNEKNTATKITLNEAKSAFFIDNSLYVCVAPTSAGFVSEYTTSFLYDPVSGKTEKTGFTEKEDREPPDLSGHTDLGSLSSQINASKWDGSFCKDAITELNNTNPYEVILYLYNTADKTYCSGKISLQDLLS